MLLASPPLLLAVLFAARSLSGPLAPDLVTPRFEAPPDDVRNVAIVVWEGMEILDFAGPAEVFSSTMVDGEHPFHVYTVGATKEPIRSQGFVRIVPQFDFADCPPPDLVVLPGGGTGSAAPAVVPWIREIEARCELLLSVCTGAFLLAEAGLLDGRPATTWHGAVSALEKRYPKVSVEPGGRFVDSGRIVTCAGVSAGIDGALHVVARLCGEEAAKATARYMEYEGSAELVSVTPASSSSVTGVDSNAHDDSVEKDDSAAAEGWVCPPCSEPCHGIVREEPGNCSVCGMELVPRASVPDAVVLLYEDVDFAEAAAWLAALSAAQCFFVHTVADTTDEVRLLEGLSVEPAFDFDHCPSPEVLVIPGGYGALEVAQDDRVLDFVRAAAKDAKFTAVTGGGLVVAAASGIETQEPWLGPAWVERLLAQRGLGLSVTVEADRSVDRRCEGRVWSVRDAAAATRAALDAVQHFTDAGRATRTAERLGVEWRPR